MVKVGPSANYYVRARPEAWEYSSPQDASLYEGVFQVALQFTVGIAFVPDISAVAPPWEEGDVLPPHGNRLTTATQARLSAALSAYYVVTPNVSRAGTQDRFEWSTDDEPSQPRTVFYVTPDDYRRYLAELDQLSEDEVGKIHSFVRVDALRDYEVIRFIEHRIVDSPYLLPGDATMLGRTR
jgi:hypothetical protein